MSAPAIKHPGFEEMRTALLTALFAHTSSITSVISFCIWMDSVLTWRVKVSVTPTHTWLVKVFHKSHLGVWGVHPHHRNVILDFVVHVGSG